MYVYVHICLVRIDFVVWSFQVFLPDRKIDAKLVTTVENLYAVYSDKKYAAA